MKKIDVWCDREEEDSICDGDEEVRMQGLFLFLNIKKTLKKT
jgi:hypothetical protein